MPQLVRYLTISEIARRLGVPRHRVEYVIGAREILPACRIGPVPGFSEQNVEEVRAEIDRIKSAR